MALDFSCVYHTPVEDYQILKHSSIFFSWADLLLPKSLNVNFNFCIHYFNFVSMLKLYGPLGNSEMFQIKLQQEYLRIIHSPYAKNLYFKFEEKSQSIFSSMCACGGWPVVEWAAGLFWELNSIWSFCFNFFTLDVTFILDFK